MKHARKWIVVCELFFAADSTLHQRSGALRPDIGSYFSLSKSVVVGGLAKDLHLKGETSKCDRTREFESVLLSEADLV